MSKKLVTTCCCVLLFAFSAVGETFKIQVREADYRGNFKEFVYAVYDYLEPGWRYEGSQSVHIGKMGGLSNNLKPGTSFGGYSKTKETYSVKVVGSKKAAVALISIERAPGYSTHELCGGRGYLIMGGVGMVRCGDCENGRIRN